MRQQTLTMYLFLPLFFLIFIAFCLVFFLFGERRDQAYRKELQDRDLSYAYAVADRIDTEIHAQINFLEILAKSLQDNLESSESLVTPVSRSLVEEQNLFKSIIIADQDGHVHWASLGAPLEWVHLATSRDTRMVELAYFNQGLVPYFLHTFPVEKGYSKFRIIGIFDQSFLGPLCKFLRGSQRTSMVIIFPNSPRFKAFECTGEEFSDSSQMAAELPGKRWISEIKSLINDKRFRDSIVKDLGIQEPTTLPVKVGFFTSRVVHKESSTTGGFYIFGIGLVLALLQLVVLIKAARAVSYNLSHFEKNFRSSDHLQIENIPVSNVVEIDRHLLAMKDIFKNHEDQRVRGLVMQKAFLSLFSAKNLDNLIERASEIIGKQMDAKLVLFVPSDNIDKRLSSGSGYFFGVHGWCYQEGNVSRIDSGSIVDYGRLMKDYHVYDHKISSKECLLGVFKVGFEKTPSDFKMSLLHGITYLIESTIEKYETLKKEVSVTIESDLAFMVQSSIFESKSMDETKADVSYFFQPTSKLGGDWFYLFESEDKQRLTFLIGDVSGSGLTQGLASTAAKGAMDMVVALLQEKNNKNFNITPSEILSNLSIVLRRVIIKSELTMCCLCGQIFYNNRQILICNAGHTFPIIVRRKKSSEEQYENDLIYLSKNQNSLLGQSDAKYVDAEYFLQADDFLFIYTDGLSEIKDIKSTVFQRILHRKLKSIDLSHSSNTIRDEVANLFKYYAQGQVIEDDVCFLFIKLPDHLEKKSNLMAL